MSSVSTASFRILRLTSTFPGDARLTLLLYAVLARQAGDEQRAMRIAGHLARILSEQAAPEGSPLPRALLASFIGDRTTAQREFGRAFVPGKWNRRTLEALGAIEDRDRVFHGIAATPEIQQMLSGERQRGIELAASIDAEAPDLLDPADTFAVHPNGSG